MKKHIYWMSALAICFATLSVSCNKDRDGEKSEAEKLLDLPYSKLTPDQQKAKLEQESINFLQESQHLANSPALKAIENLANLFDRSEPNIPEPIEKVNDVKDIFNLEDVTGVFTWNNAQGRWIETPSSTELKFVFPAVEGGTTNNATLTVTTQNSGITFTETWWDYRCESYWDPYWGWQYDCEDIEREMVYHLPNSAVGTLTINNSEAAKIQFGAEYKNGKEVPETATYKMTTNDGYEWSWMVDKVKEQKISMKLSRNGNSLLEAVANATTNIDKLTDLVIEAMEEDNELDIEDVYKNLGKADAVIKLMGDLMLVNVITDGENFARELVKLAEWINDRNEELWDLQEGTSQHATLFNQYQREAVEREMKIYNDFLGSALISTKDNYKIADMVAFAERDEDYDWYHYLYYGQKIYRYHLNFYLKFNDNTLIEAETYFGSGFNLLINEWEEFLKAFGIEFDDDDY
ncbi:MAG: hypothetical protein FWG79_09010 [Bacteroidales bacterium]|nr:hypothetical protein [Bacteroidales bacterium]